MQTLKKIVVFASGSGTNFETICENCANGTILGEVKLLVVSKAGVGAVKRAQKYNVPVLVEGEKDVKKTLLAIKPDLICLAGYLKKLPPELLTLCPVMNIHPALLPAFGGKGFYGERVHQAVLESGAKITGVTVHFIDEEYDKGAIIRQKTVPVLENDTPSTLAARVLQVEHSLYVKCIQMFCNGELAVQNNKIIFKRKKTEGIQRALISVSDKSGLAEFAHGLHKMGVELISTSGTAKFLKEQGLPVRDLSGLTNFPEILDGRVKTLHPYVHAGILFKRDDAAHVHIVEALGIEPIDLLVVNLYPFRETAAKAAHSFAPEVIENIDIGGPSMVRSAAKNFAHVAVVCRPKDYPAVLKEMQENKTQLSEQTRRQLCIEAFTHTAAYDAAISEEFKKGLGETYPETKIVVLEKIQSLRYGENPAQSATLYTQGKGFSFEQLHGKELSYNNILDAFGTWDAVHEFNTPACVIFKHVTPCGVGVGANLKEAFENAKRSDPKSAYGGIAAFNRTVDKEVAEALSTFFVEAVGAPDYTPQALEILQQKKNLRILRRNSPQSKRPLLRSVGDEVLMQSPDLLLFKEELTCPTKRKPTPAEETALKFAWVCVKHIKSNAIVLTSQNGTVGIGAGQMSRVDAVKMAGIKFAEYLETNPKPDILVLGSDAFFPFRDGVDLAASLGISAIINPGGSIRDEEVVKACDEHNLALLLTGVRHFRH